VKKVINSCNKILNDWVYYYGWSNAYSRLKQLNNFLYNRFKRKLIKKFRNRGKRRIKWVMQKFILCRTNVFKSVLLQSPFNKKTHIHAQKGLYLYLSTKIWKIFPINKCILPLKLRKIPYYINPKWYNDISINLIKIRLLNKEIKNTSFLKKKEYKDFENCPYYWNKI
jgi:hypothetical protein